MTQPFDDIFGNNTELIEFYQQIISQGNVEVIRDLNNKHYQHQETLFGKGLVYKRGGVLRVTPQRRKEFETWFAEYKVSPPPENTPKEPKDVIPVIKLLLVGFVAFILSIFLHTYRDEVINIWRYGINYNLQERSAKALESFEYAQLSSLKEHNNILQQFIQKQKNKTSFSDYSIVQPLLNHQKMLSNIYQIGEYPINKTPTGNINTLYFNPVLSKDKLQLLAGTNDGKLILFDQKNPQKPSTINNDNNNITNIQYDSEGKYIAVSTKEQDKRLRLYKNEPSTIPQLIDDEDDESIGKEEIKSLSFDSSSKYLLAGDEVGKITLFSVENDKLFKKKQTSNKGSINAIKFISNSKPNYFAVVGNYNEVLIYDLEKFISFSESDKSKKYEPEIEIKTPLKSIFSISFNPDGKLMTIVGKTDDNSDNNQLCLKKFEINKPNSDINLKINPENCQTIEQINKVIFSPKNEQKQLLIATASDNGSIKIYIYNKNLDLKDSLSERISLYAHYTDDKQEKSAQNQSGKKILSLQFSQDAETLATSGEDGKIKLWKISKLWDNLDIENVNSQNSLKLMDVGFADSDQKESRVIFITDENKLKIHDLTSGINKIKDQSKFDNIGNIMIINYKQNNYLVVTDIQQNKIKFYNLSGDGETYKNIGNNGELNLSEISDNFYLNKIYGNENYFALVYDKDKIYVWDSQGEKYADRNKAIYNNVKISNVEISQDGKYLIAKSQKKNNDLTKWQILNNKFEPQEITCINSNNINMFKISPDNSKFVVATDNGNLTLCNLENGELLDEPKHFHSAEIKDLQFSSDGKYMITLDENKKAILWKFDEKNKEENLEEITKETKVQTIAISPDYKNYGTLIAIATVPTNDQKNNNKVVKILDIQGREIAEYQTDMDSIQHLKFTPLNPTDSNPKYENYLVVGDENGNIKAWEINNAQKLLNKSDQWLKASYNWGE